MSKPVAETLDPLALMERETQLHFGPVPDSLGAAMSPGMEAQIADNAYLVRRPEFACVYRRGDGVTAELLAEDGEGLLHVYLAGSVHAAIAAINGLFPLHASAVLAGGKAYVFTGASGAGKSVLAASLSQVGFPLVCDDTLVIDPASVPLACLPGHKRLKLWPEGQAITQIPGSDVVSPEYPKIYADLPASEINNPVPLAGLIALQEGEHFSMEPITGSAKLTLLQDNHYTRELRDYCGSMDAGIYFDTLARIARDIPMYRFTRPFDPVQFSETRDRLATWLEEQA
jgi:hypothetical protein